VEMHPAARNSRWE